MAADDLSVILPRVVIVSRRTVRKNKFVDFVGEYHLDLIVGYGAVPVIVPRVSGIETVLESFEPIHGVLLCEGEDIDPSWYEDDANSSLSPEEVEEIRRLHASDTNVDKEKDSIELRLAKLCIERNIPYLGICRGSQVLNVACGGTLYQDVGKEVSRNLPQDERVVHIDYDNYDGHRHPIRILDGTPLHSWFKNSLEPQQEELVIMVNSYHHQGVKKLAPRFIPMAFSPDGLVEGYYDPNMYNPDEGRFVMGLQFHPERMRHPESNEFDYLGCPYAYKEFVRAVVAYQKKLDTLKAIPKTVKLNTDIDTKRKVIIRSFSLAKDLYLSTTKTSNSSNNKASTVELKAGADFLESNTLSSQQEIRLKEMGATVRNAYSYFDRMKVNDEREKVARKIMDQMSIEQLTDLMSFYHMMGKICGEVVERKLLQVVSDQVFCDTN